MQSRHINSVRMGIWRSSLPSVVCHTQVVKVCNAQDCVGNLSHIHKGKVGGGGWGGGVVFLGHWPPTVQLCCSATVTVYELMSFSELLSFSPSYFCPWLTFSVCFSRFLLNPQATPKDLWNPTVGRTLN